MTMGMVDTLMVGRLSPEAIGAVGVGSSLFISVAIFSMGLMLGLDALVSRAFGAGDLEDCHRWLVHARGARAARVAAFHAGPVRAWPVCSGDGVSRRRCWSSPGRISNAVTWSVPPLLLYSAFRRYLQGMGVVRPIMVALISRQHRQRGLQLDSDLRAPRRAGHGGSRIGVVDGARAHA